MRGLITAFPFPSGAGPCLTTGISAKLASKRRSGVPHRGPVPSLARQFIAGLFSFFCCCDDANLSAVLRWSGRQRQRRNMARDCPQERGDLACDRHDDNGVALSLRHQASIPCAQACLRLPCNVAHLG